MEGLKLKRRGCKEIGLPPLCMGRKESVGGGKKGVIGKGRDDKKGEVN